MSSNATKTKQKTKMSKSKIVAIITVVVILVFFVACQIYLAQDRSSVTTEIALEDSAARTITTDAIVIRDEKLLSADSGNNVVSAVNDGTRVSVSDIVAYSFNNSESAVNVIKMNEISEQITYYTELSKKSSVIVSDTSIYNNQIADQLFSFSKMLSSGNLTDINEYENNLRDAIISKQTSTGQQLDLTTVISTLQSEYESLKSTTLGYSEIISGSTGYYISGSDGYENMLSYEEVDQLKADDVTSVLNAEPQPSSSVGRIVHGYYWYTACVVDTSSINGLKEGASKKISFRDTSVNDLKTTVYRIVSDTATGKSLVIFSCNTMNESIALLRKETIIINLDDYEGFRIDNNAIRVNDDGVKGVYIIEGRIVRFRRVNILYSTADYSIVTGQTDDDIENNIPKSEFIAQYDEYIVKGYDLSDGKLIA